MHEIPSTTILTIEIVSCKSLLIECVCIEYASVCAFAYVHWMHNRLWSWRCWKAGDKCRNRFIQVTNTSCWRDTLALCTREKTQTSLKIHSYHMAFTFLLSYRVGQPKSFWDFCLYVHGRRLAKSWLDTNFQPIRKSFDHVTEAPTHSKLPTLIYSPWEKINVQSHSKVRSPLNEVYKCAWIL